MTMLTHIGSSRTITSSFRRTVIVLLRRIGRRVDHWVAITIANRERQVVRSMLHGLNDRDLKDFGVCRGEIDSVLTDATEMLERRLRS